MLTLLSFLEISYGQLFQYGLVVQFILIIISAAVTKVMKKDHPYRPFFKALTAVIAFSMLFLLLSYAWQSQAGWLG